ncbi:MAG: hypothetical protein H7145_18830 [Akkermansiaceae bacterium]|nr:hypothetical protein [Armatimonadota bacterium]
MTTIFSGMGSPDALLSGTASANKPLRVNAHIHLPPNFSAFETAKQAIDLAKEQGITVLGVSNYYDYSVYEEFTALARQNGIFPVFGLEIITLDDALVKSGVLINDPGNPGKFYICGKGITKFNPLSPDALALLNVIRERDSGRMAAVTDRLAVRFSEAGLDTGLTATAVKERVVARHGSPIETVYLQERHVAQAFQEILFERIPTTERAGLLARAFGVTPKSAPDDANAVQNEIRSALMKAGKPAFVPETFVDREHAFRLILALGGVPCYPTLADGTIPVCGFEEPVEDLIARLKNYGFTCAEFIPIRNTPEVLAKYVSAMRDAGIVVTAGTEHNTRDLLPIAPTCLKGAPIPAETRAIFEEGACVLAAHQYLASRGEPGFVGAGGEPNPDFATDEARIAHFAKLGKAVIDKYLG